MGIARIISNRKRVLGLNERYLGYIREYNRRGAFRIADNKILTKKRLQDAGIPVPPLIAVINNYEELAKFDFSTLPASFVMKPVNGMEGGGIEIFYNKVDDCWIKADKSKVSHNQLIGKIQDILDGKFSLHNQADSVMFEERIKSHKDFRYFTFKGAPDVRVIVFNSIPVMSYVRLPTEQSEGKANLALGAVGAAIDIAAGRVTTAILGKQGEIEYTPDRNIRLSGLRIPYWNKILEYAIKAHQVTKLGFAAVDFLIDRDLGPMIVELNARPGLSIQLANQDGLRWRLAKVKGVRVDTIQKGIRIGKDLFGGEIEETVENITGKQVVGIIEQIELYGPNGEKEELKAKVDTGADSTSIDRKLLERLGYGPQLKQFDTFIAERLKGIDLEKMSRPDVEELSRQINEETKDMDMGLARITEVFSSHGVSLRPYFNIEMKMSGIKFPTVCSAYDRSKLTYSVIIGKNSLANYLIDPSKK